MFGKGLFNKYLISLYLCGDAWLCQDLLCIYPKLKIVTNERLGRYISHCESRLSCSFFKHKKINGDIETKLKVLLEGDVSNKFILFFIYRPVIFNQF